MCSESDVSHVILNVPKYPRLCAAVIKNYV